MPLVFVFGTLKAGFPNHDRNAGVRVPGRFVTVAPHPLLLVGERHSPWMLDAPGEGLPVAGEVYDVDDAALADMDRLERIGEPDGYVRRLIAVRRVDGDAGAATTCTVHAYLKPPVQLDPREVRAGPLAGYTLQHAALYRRRG